MIRPADSRPGRRYLTARQVHEIQCATGLLKHIAPKYGISIAHVSRIKTGSRWKWETEYFAAVQLNATLATMACTGRV